MKKRLLTLIVLGLMGIPGVMLQAETASYTSVSQNQILPTNYSMKRFQSSVKDQKSEGLCWSYVANGLLESAIMKKEGIMNPNAFDFSESHMDYATSKMYADSYGFDRSVGDGGYFNIAVAYWDRQAFNGPIAASSISNEEQLMTMLSTYQPENYYVTRTASLEELEKSSSAAKKAEYIEQIKELIYNYGGVAASFYCGNYEANPESYSMDPHYANKDIAYYCSKDETPNHGAIIIGWDDAYSRAHFNAEQQPESDGAFLVKNSWGSRWGNGGYFWVSYENAFYNVNAIAEVAHRDFYDQLYEYDKQGLVGTVSYDEKLTTNAYMNRFQTKQNANEKLTAVSTYAVGSGNSYKVYVSTDGDTSHLKEVKLSNMGSYDDENGYYVEHAGFMTLMLSEPVALKKGSDFLVAIEVLQGKGQEGNCQVPVEINNEGYSQGVSAELGRSFIGPDIRHLMTGKKYDIGKDEGNICLKAYTKTE